MKEVRWLDITKCNTGIFTTHNASQSKHIIILYFIAAAVVLNSHSQHSLSNWYRQFNINAAKHH